MTQATDHNENQPMVVMQPTDHLQTALELLDAADLEFALGRGKPACEMVWGAAVKAMTAAAQQHGWPHSNEESLWKAAKRLADEWDYSYWYVGFSVASKFQKHYYQDIAFEFEIQGDRPIVRRFIERLCARLAANGAATPGG